MTPIDIVQRTVGAGFAIATAAFATLACFGAGCDGDPCSTAALDGAWASCARAQPTSLASEETCCQGRGWCFQRAILPSSQATQLAQDVCPSTDACVPKDLAVPTFVPPRCRSVGDSEGRCLSTCLPTVATQAGQLPQASCDADYRCVPCFDPITGASTGACSLTAGDSPVDPPEIFASCCSGAGACVPQSEVPAAQAMQLGKDSCSEADSLCAPKVLRSSSYVPPTCASVGQAEGRCLPTCLPSVASKADTLPQASCDAGSRCVPCFDPVTGASTGACTLSSGDSPKAPPTLFASCCSAAGKCVPQSEVPSSQASQLGRDSCSTQDSLCVPQPFLGSGYVPPTCASVDQAEGRCLPTCLPGVASQASRLPQASCDAGSRCVPCFDPVTGASTGACTLSPGDSPKTPPTVFASCCSGAGKCVPESEVPSSQVSQLGKDSCSTSGGLCVPQDLLSSGYVPPTCASVNQAEGRCLPTCLPSVASQASQLPQASCDAGSLCVPCFNPITGASTGGCTLSPGDSPKQPPYRFPTCCSDGTNPRGTCVPSGDVPASQAANLSADTCATDAGANLCVPTQKLLNSAYQFPQCTAQVLLTTMPGACVPDCLPATQGLNGLVLSSAGCQTREKCVPCTNPSTGSPTGACS